MMFATAPVRWWCPYTASIASSVDVMADPDGWSAALLRIGLQRMLLYVDVGPADLPEDRQVDVAAAFSPALEEKAFTIIRAALVAEGQPTPTPLQPAAGEEGALVLRLPEPVLSLLRRLQQLGLFGLTVEDVAERLISERLRDRHIEALTK